MQRDVLPFDREEINEDEIKEHIIWYYNKVQYGYELLRENNKQEAREVLREINNHLDKEYKYYHKSAVQKVMWDNNLYNEYYYAILEASAKQNRKNSYDTLNSNFYDIRDYLINYNSFSKYIDEQN